MKKVLASQQAERPAPKTVAQRVAAHRKRKDLALLDAQAGLREAARVIAGLLARIDPNDVPLVMDAKLADLIADALHRQARDSDAAERDRAWSARKAFLIKRINGAALAVGADST